MRFKMSFGQGIKNPVNIDKVKNCLNKVDETVENLKTLEKLWKWIKKLSKLIKR
jgi:hypothetical protein